MNLLFISYWGFAEELTQATVLPHVKLLARRNDIHAVYLATIERSENFPDTGKMPEKVFLAPFISRNFNIRVLTKLCDFIGFAFFILRLAGRNKIELTICRSAFAGFFGYILHRSMQIPYAVESFEPHSSYMVESGVWRKFGLSWMLYGAIERLHFRSAAFLLPVSEAFARLLRRKSVSAKIRVLPCTVSPEWPTNTGQISRKQLGISETATVGIYVGKFGGLYYGEEAFQIFRFVSNRFDDFRLIILTPDDQREVNAQLKKYSLDRNSFVSRVPHAEVVAYLQLADFGFATYKPSPSKRFLSPIKVGEYWSAGLPVLLTAGVGDDSDIIATEGGGALFSLEPDTLPAAVEALKTQLTIPRSVRMEKIRSLAARYRNPDLVKERYQEVIDFAFGKRGGI